MTNTPPMAQAEMTLNRLEKAVLQMIRATTPEIASALDEQLKEVLVSNRENTEVGFFTTMRPRHTKILIEEPRVIGNVFAKIEGLQNPMTFVLFITDGLIELLEGASIDESTSDIDFSTVKFEMLKASVPH